MAKTGYEQKSSESVQKLIDDILALGGIGYVALNCGQEVLMRLSPGIESATTSDSNFFEELLVNPALLKLASQRGELDCGGFEYVAVGYGEFMQLIMQIENGHISLGISKETTPGELVSRVNAVLKRHQKVWKAPENWLFD